MLGSSMGRRVEFQGLAEVLQSLTGPVLVFQGQAQEEVDVEAGREGGVELRQGRQGLKGRGVQGRGLGQVENDVGVAGAVQEMGAGDQHVNRREIKGGVGDVDHQDFQPQAGQGLQAEANLVLEVGPGEVGEAVQGNHGAGSHEIGRLLQGLILGERGPVAGAAVEIPGQLGHLG